jgi:hypothetical protein
MTGKKTKKFARYVNHGLERETQYLKPTMAKAKPFPECASGETSFMHQGG